MNTTMVEAVHVAPGMTVVNHETREQYTVLQNAKVNRVLVMRRTTGEVVNAAYDDYQQPVEVIP